MTREQGTKLKSELDASNHFVSESNRNSCASKK